MPNNNNTTIEIALPENLGRDRLANQVQSSDPIETLCPLASRAAHAGSSHSPVQRPDLRARGHHPLARLKKNRPPQQQANLLHPLGPQPQPPQCN